jgi:hypothetical protein
VPFKRNVRRYSPALTKVLILANLVFFGGDPVQVRESS